MRIGFSNKSTIFFSYVSYALSEYTHKTRNLSLPCKREKNKNKQKEVKKMSSIKKTCDKCKEKINEISGLYLVQIHPKVLHYCWDCCNDEGIRIDPFHQIAEHLV